MGAVDMQLLPQCRAVLTEQSPIGYSLDLPTSSLLMSWAKGGLCWDCQTSLGQHQPSVPWEPSDVATAGTALCPSVPRPEQELSGFSERKGATR